MSVAMSRRLAVVFLFSMVLLPACTGDDDAATSTTFAPPSTNPPLPTTTATTTTETTTTTPTTTDPPAVATTVETSTPDSMPGTTAATTLGSTTSPAPDDDWVAIVQGLYDQLADISAAPGTERISEFCVTVESPCREKQGAQIEALVRDRWRVVDPVPIPVLSAMLVTTVDDLDPAESTLVVLDVVVGPRDGVVGTIVDEDGNVLFEVDDETSAPSPVSWFVRFEDDAGWRVFETRGSG